MDIIFILLVVLSIIVGYLLLNTYLYKKRSLNIEGYSSMCPDGEPCPSGCNKPTTVSGNCNSKIYKDDDGKCYKLCSYDCTDPLAECAYNECCENCGKVKVYVDCNTGKELDDSIDINDKSQESNHSSSPINNGKSNTSKSDIRGTIITQETLQTVPLSSSNKKQSSTSRPTSQSKQMINRNNNSPAIIEYNKQLYGLLKNTVKTDCVDCSKITSMTPMTSTIVDDPTKQLGTPNKYRVGGDISNALDDQSTTMNIGLSQKQNPHNIMNYGVYGTSKSSMPTNVEQQNNSITGIYNTTDSISGYNSLYSVKF